MPFPANYGGVIDVYHKIRKLHDAGVRIHLHCFTSGRGRAPELAALCEEIFYYRRKTGLWSNFSLLPYTVRSRRSEALKKRLLTNNYPVLFEVLHTCLLMADPDFKDRRLIFRHSNIEHDYYAALAKADRNFLRKIFHYVEAWRLRSFEKILKHADLIFAVNKKDLGYFKEHYPDTRSVYLPSFHENDNLEVLPGKGEYALVHGNLSISENYEAVLWFLKNVLSRTATRTIVAGLNPPAFLVDEIAKYQHVKLFSSPSKEEMDKLISQAHVHLLYTAQPTGLKLKLLNVLFSGRFIVSNSHMVAGTGISANHGLKIVSEGGDYLKALNELMGLDFDDAMIEERKMMLSPFENAANTRLLLEEVFAAG